MYGLRSDFSISDSNRLPLSFITTRSIFPLLSLDKQPTESTELNGC